MTRKPPALVLTCLCGFLAFGVVPAAWCDANIISPKLCFVLTIPGDWEPGEDPGTYVSKDGAQFVGVLQFSSKDLKKSKGDTLVEKEAAALVQSYEKELRGKLLDVRLEPFQSPMEHTWKWTATLPENGRASRVRSPKRYIIDLTPGGVDGIIVLNIQRTPDDDDLARRTIATVKFSKDRPCQLPRSVDDLLTSVGIRPGSSAQAPEPLVTYNSTLYGWSVSYPKGWKVEDSKPEFVQVRPANESGLCGIHAMGVESKYKTTEAFADFMLSEREKQFGDVKSLLRQPAKLPGGLSGIESLADIQAKGRSHQLFVVASEAAYVVDCETEIPNWGKLAPSFEAVIRSFSVPNLTELTEADTTQARTFAHPQHHWSIAYPGGWKLDAVDPGNVSIRRPDSFGYAGCGIHSRPGAQYTSLEDFAAASLRRSAESQIKEGVQVRVMSRMNITLRNGVAGIEVLREMKVANEEESADGRSRVVFILADGMGYIVDCQTDARMWDTLALVFEQIISSFTIQKKP